jgi:RecA-family ATPase
MDSRQNILDALDALNPSRLTYDEWKDVGMALKAEGFPCSVWDSWSARDSERYHINECEKKWNTFNGSGVNGGTIVFFAKQYGNYTPSKKWTFDDYLPAEAEGYEQIIADSSPDKDKPYQMAVTYLEALFEPDEIVGYVHSAELNEDRQKWIPANRGIWRKCEDIVKDLKKYRKLDPAFGSINEEAGAWIRINPLDGKGATDKNVTVYRYALVEADSMPIEDQKKLLINMRLPIKALVESGGKSVHAIVKIGAENEQEYKQRVSFLFNKLAEQSFIVDTANKNPSRLSRLPGAMRAGNLQRLLGIDLGCSSWEDWLDFVNGVDDDLPEIVAFSDMIDNPPEEVPELIHGILHVGCKMIITADSKAGKSCMAENLAICIAEGKPWMKRFQCEKGRVLYIDLELSQRAIYDRTQLIRKELEVTSKIPNLEFFPLRGYAESLETLLPKIVRRARSKNYSAIVIDPLYKIQSGDENSAEALSKFCNALDRLARETGAALIITHHHPKGHAGDRKAIDRGAGSGVIARDADAIIDLAYLDPGDDPNALLAEVLSKKHKPMQMAFILRDFESPEDSNVFFKFPIHFFDTEHLLDGAPVEGSRDANLQKSPKRTTEERRRRTLDEIFEAVQMDGAAALKDMNKYADGKPSPRTLRRYVEEFSDDYLLENGVVTKV